MGLLVDGKWQKVSWDEAISEIGDQLLKIREESSPDSVYWLGSAKFNNEQAYLYRKLAAMWGTNNVDHQARICHSTTVAGVANTWGYGAIDIKATPSTDVWAIVASTNENSPI